MDTVEEAGDKLFTFTRVPPSQWKSIRTPNAIERLHEEFKRGSRRKPAALRRDSRLLLRAPLPSGQITMRKVDGWESLAQKPVD
jgi:transposase-like protein